MTGQTMQEKLQKAVEAQDAGIPVDWQALCLETYNVATQEIGKLSAELAELKSEHGVDDAPTPVDTAMTPPAA